MKINETPKLIWCTVDTDNYFFFEGDKYEISQDIKEYRVKNKAVLDENGEYNDYTNDSMMDKIVISVEDYSVTFLDQNLMRIDSSKVRVVK